MAITILPRNKAPRHFSPQSPQSPQTPLDMVSVESFELAEIVIAAVAEVAATLHARGEEIGCEDVVGLALHDLEPDTGEVAQIIDALRWVLSALESMEVTHAG